MVLPMLHLYMVLPMLHLYMVLPMLHQISLLHSYSRNFTLKIITNQNKSLSDKKKSIKFQLQLRNLNNTS